MILNFELLGDEQGTKATTHMQYLVFWVMSCYG